MSQVEREEIEAGLVCFLDPSDLTREGATTNAALGQEVYEPHYFLLLEIVDDRCLAPPLYSEAGKDRTILSRQLKEGCPMNWIDQDSYAFRWQFWWLPHTAIYAASTRDTSDSTNRRFYKADGLRKVDELRNALSKARLPFRSIS